MKIALFDIEANELLLDVTVVWCIAIKPLGEDVELYGPHQLVEAIDRLNEFDMVVAHNGVGYDVPVIAKVLGRTIPKCFDTQLLSRVVYPDKYVSPVGEHSLKEWGLFLGVHKADYEGGFSEYTDEMGAYCIQDVVTLEAVFLYQQAQGFFSSYADSIKLEHKVAEIITKQYTQGVLLDKEAAIELAESAEVVAMEVLCELQKEVPPRLEEMKTPEYWDTKDGFQYPTKGAAKKAGYKDSEITRGPNKVKEHLFSPRSGEKIVQHFRTKYKWKPTKLTKGGQAKKKLKQPLNRLKDYACSEEVLQDLPYPEAAKILEWRAYDDKVTKSRKWLEVARPTGRIHGSIITNGAYTGRMTHSKPNLAQVPKVVTGPGKQILKGRAGKFGYECRRCFIPDPCWWMVGADASGIELRMLGNGLFDYDGGRYIDLLLHGDVHDETQRAMRFNSRDLTKTFTYAVLYGGGGPRIGAILGTNPREGDKLKRQFLQAIPGLEDFIADLSHKLRCTGCIRGLDGGELKRQSRGRKIPLRKANAILNTRLQHDGAIIMKKALVLYDRWAENTLGPHGSCWAYLLNVHDEIQQQGKTKEQSILMGEQVVEAIKRAGTELGLRCPLDGEYKVGRNWAECH